MADGRRIRLLLVDDRVSTRRGLRMWLALHPDLCVVGEAEDDADVAHLVVALDPDVVLMDLELPRRCGLAITAAVHLADPDLPVVLLCLHDDIETRARARVAGAAAIVAKHELEPLLIRTIRDVAGWRAGTRRVL